MADNERIEGARETSKADGASEANTIYIEQLAGCVST